MLKWSDDTPPHAWMRTIYRRQSETRFKECPFRISFIATERWIRWEWLRRLYPYFRLQQRSSLLPIRWTSFSTCNLIKQVLFGPSYVMGSLDFICGTRFWKILMYTIFKPFVEGWWLRWLELIKCLRISTRLTSGWVYFGPYILSVFLQSKYYLLLILFLF